MSLPEEFENIYGGDVVLMLLKTIYGLKNKAKAFWRELSREFSVMVGRRINAYPCMYFKWTSMGPLVWL